MTGNRARVSEPVIIGCGICGKPIEHLKDLRIVYCSVECREEAYRKMRNENSKKFYRENKDVKPYFKHRNQKKF